MSPFAAVPDTPDRPAWRALAELIGPAGAAVLFRGAFALPPGWHEAGRWPCWQMTCERPLAPDGARAVETLSAADREAMLALATATQPGPFFLRTHELGRFVGVHGDGRLIAMAGERLHVDGATEISAVCTDPAHRRTGLAADLVRTVAARIQARGETAFLHVAEDNVGAIRVYEALGFTRRARIAAVLVRAPA